MARDLSTPRTRSHRARRKAEAEATERRIAQLETQLACERDRAMAAEQLAARRKTDIWRLEQELQAETEEAVLSPACSDLVRGQVSVAILLMLVAYYRTPRDERAAIDQQLVDLEKWAREQHLGVSTTVNNPALSLIATFIPGPYVSRSLRLDDVVITLLPRRRTDSGYELDTEEAWNIIDEHVQSYIERLPGLLATVRQSE